MRVNLLGREGKVKQSGTEQGGKKKLNNKIIKSPRIENRGSVQFSSDQSLSCVQLFVTQWTATCQASLCTPTPRVYLNSCPFSR